VVGIKYLSILSAFMLEVITSEESFVLALFTRIPISIRFSDKSLSIFEPSFGLFTKIR
jgi:hypothetical protein